MPFKFQWFCELLDELHATKHHRATTSSRNQNPDYRIIRSWFDKYDHKIVRNGPSAIAFLSCLFPERRVDRVFNLQEKRLSPVFGRALGLGNSRLIELNQWRQRDGDDFPTCVERVMAECEFDVPPVGREVTLEQIDVVLHQVAANSPFSSSVVRACANGIKIDELLRPILHRLQSSEAKWLIRMITKSYGSVCIPEWFTLHEFHFLLPDLLKTQNSFDAAIKTLSKPTISVLPARPDKHFESSLRPFLAREIVPILGIMIRRQPYHKARSIKHCTKLSGKRQMSVERKYDGEYCQIHIDLSKRHDCIQIFSKSGKDSTSDRLRLHGAIRDSLRIGQNGCRIQKQCIIEGELLVWSWRSKQILPFYRIRNHVKHGRRYLGNEKDSPVKSDEELMVVFYDLLMLDDKLLVNESHTIRRRHLKALLHTIDGRCMLAERTIIDFASSRASRKLREAFANSITQRWEGLVLKACDEPYFSFKTENHGIKLKKDYITKMGDSADLCIVGGCRNAKIEEEIGSGSLRWTSFQVACIVNKEDVQRFGTKPAFRIIDELSYHSMHISQLQELNKVGALLATPFANSTEQFDILAGDTHIRMPTELFKEPFIVEIMGAGFERLQNSSFYTLRFPRKVDSKVKVHSDRTIVDTVSFTELQEMAKRSMQPSEAAHSQEDAQWISQLIRADGKLRSTPQESQSTTPGRSPQSMQAATISPLSLSKERPTSFFIREDTEELLDEQSQHTKVSLSSNISSKPVEEENSVTVDQAIEEPDVSGDNAVSPTCASDKPSEILPTLEQAVCNESFYHGYQTAQDFIREIRATSQNRKRRRSEPEQPKISGIAMVRDRARGGLEVTVSYHLDKDKQTQTQTPSPSVNRSAPTAMNSSRPRISKHSVPRDVGPTKSASLHTRDPASNRQSNGLVKQRNILQDIINPPTNEKTRVTTTTTTTTITTTAHLPTSEHPDNEDPGISSVHTSISYKTAPAMPTPPTSSSIEPKFVSSAMSEPLNAQLITPNSSVQAKTLSSSALVQSEADCPSKNDPLQNVSLDHTRPVVSGPIFITNSVGKLLNSRADLHDVLHRTKSSFTFSVEHFLDHIDSSTGPSDCTTITVSHNNNGGDSLAPYQKTLHILLVDFENIPDSKRDTRDLFSHFVFRSRTQSQISSSSSPSSPPTASTTATRFQSYSHRVLVYDYHILTDCPSENKTVDIALLHRLRNDRDTPDRFGGIVKFEQQRFESGKGPKYILTTDWEWLDPLTCTDGSKGI